MPAYSKSNQLAIQPTQKWNSNQPNVHHISRSYSNCLLAFPLTRLVAHTQTPLPVESLSIERNIHFIVFDGQKAYHQLLFLPNWNYYHETKSFSLNFVLLESDLWKIRKSSEITQNMENYEQSWNEFEWLWKTWERARERSRLCAAQLLFFLFIWIWLWFRWYCFDFFCAHFECSSNPVRYHEIIDKLEYVLVFSAHTPEKRE